MALSGSFNGSFSGASSPYPYITWSATQSIAGNYSDVTVNLYFNRGNQWAFNLTGNATGNININGDYSTSSITFDLRNQQTQLVRSRTVRVYHNADGSKTCFLQADGDTNVSWGTYNFSQTVTLDTIPREAYITNAVSFQVGNNIPLTIWNGGNFYVRAQLYVNSVLIKTQDLGQVTSATLTLSSSDNTAIYNQMPNDTSKAMYVRITTFQNSNYTGQIGGNRDKSGTVTIDTAANVPTFTTYTIENVDKSIEVRDSYDNLLTTSSTQTLLGASNKMIKGYSKVRATVSVANKMVAKNSATGVKYRFTNASQQIEQNFSEVADVTLDLDNVTVNSFNVTAFDSRNLATSVANSLSYMADYTNINIFGLTLTRDNNIDAPTKLQFSGTMFKEYFGGGTSGVQNTATFHYRYKETTASWASQTWNSITPSIDGSGNISFDDYVSGDLGVGGFDSNKSFNIQVRAYDKLASIIIEGTLSRGTPLMDLTQSGVAIGGRYDEAEGGSLQVGKQDIRRYATQWGNIDGLADWTKSEFTYVNSSTMRIEGDFTSLLRKGVAVVLENGSTLKWGYIKSVTLNSGDTDIELHLTSGSAGSYSIAALANGDITNVYFGNVPNRLHRGFCLYSPTITGYSSNPTGGVYLFSVQGRMMDVILREPNTGTSNSTSLTYTLPIDGVNITNFSIVADALITDNGDTRLGWVILSAPLNLVLFQF